jgi:hypothetical protein
VHAALAPVIGQGGVAALYRRTLHLTRDAYPWLVTASEGATRPGDFISLRAALSQQDAVIAAAAQAAMLQTLRDLLTKLIGSSLTGRLLEAVWTPPSAGNTVQDPSS